MNENSITRLTKWLPLLILGVGIVATWTTLKNTSAAQEEKITSLETRTRAAEVSNNQILVQLSQIQSDLSWIRKSLDKK